MLRARLAYSRWYVRRFVRPHFEALGEGSLFFKPWTAAVHGPAVRAGRFLHVIGEPGREVRLSVWAESATEGCITLGDFVLLLPGVRVSSASSIRIGDGCMLAAGAYLTDADWHDIQELTSPAPRSGWSLPAGLVNLVVSLPGEAQPISSSLFLAADTLYTLDLEDGGGFSVTRRAR
jgi:hypothetical protein